MSFEWLRAHINDPDLVVIDCTNFATWSDRRQLYQTVSGRAHWIDEHIEGSRHADFTSQFCGDTSQYRNTLPSPKAFAQAMARLGVSNFSKVVLYDDAMSQWAARVWWMLRWIGFDHAAVLDGGWKHWDASGGPASMAPVSFLTGQLVLGELPTQRPSLFATRQDVLAAMDDGRTLLIDALALGSIRACSQNWGLPGISLAR
ncbi:MAG: thiosulfate/3-mercaptopyruvate sulfurtransferase [Paracoccaceae bacterium]